MCSQAIPVTSSVRSPKLLNLLKADACAPILENPKPGMIVLCEVAGSEGVYTSIETAPDNEKRPLSPGDRFFGVLGDRQSGSNPSGTVPEHPLHSGSRLDLLAVAGLVGNVESVPGYHGRKVLELRFVGAACDTEGRVPRIADFPPLVDAAPSLPSSQQTIVVCGSSAEVGKTTLVERLIHQLMPHGLNVAAAKIAGTGRRADMNRYLAAGAAWAADFVDTGFPSTYGLPAADLDFMLARLSAGFAKSGCDVLIVECGGDLLEGGVPHLIARLSEAKVRFAFVASDALAAKAGRSLLAMAGVEHTSVCTRLQNALSLARRLDLPAAYDIMRDDDMWQLSRELFPGRLPLGAQGGYLAVCPKLV